MTAAEIRAAATRMATEVAEGSYRVADGIYGNFYTATGGSMEALWKRLFCPDTKRCAQVRGWCSIARNVHPTDPGCPCQMILRQWKGSTTWRSDWQVVLSAQASDADACAAAQPPARG
jgi:hypothetical protein